MNQVEGVVVLDGNCVKALLLTGMPIVWVSSEKLPKLLFFYIRDRRR